MTKELIITLLITFQLLSCNSSSEDDFDYYQSKIYPICQGLKYNQKALARSNEYTIYKLEITAKTNVTLQPLVDVAKAMHANVDDYCSFLEEQIDNLIKQSGGVYEEEFGAGNEYPNHVGLLVNPQSRAYSEEIFMKKSANSLSVADEIYQKLVELKKGTYAYIEPLKDKSPRIWNSLFKNATQDKALAFLDTTIVYPVIDKSKEDWKKEIFVDKSVAHLAILLNQLKYDIGLVENRYFTFFKKVESKIKLKYWDKYEIVCTPMKRTVQLGESYQANICLGMYNSKDLLSVEIDGVKLPIEGGKASYKVKAKNVGRVNFKAKLTMINPITEEKESCIREFKYEVLP